IAEPGPRPVRRSCIYHKLQDQYLERKVRLSLFPFGAPTCLFNGAITAVTVNVLSDHKRTFRIAIAMSALHPKADMCSALVNVCFGPKADITCLQPLPSDLTGP